MTEHSTHIAGHFITTEAGTMRQVFRACCSCGWRGDEHADALPRATRMAMAQNDSEEHARENNK